MKISYSKVILGGIIASTFFMVSCQKKGSARAVTPKVVEAVPADLSKANTDKTDLAKEEEKSDKDTEVKWAADTNANSSEDKENKEQTAETTAKEEGLTNGQECSKETILKTAASIQANIIVSSNVLTPSTEDLIQKLSAVTTSCQTLKNQFTIEKVESCTYKTSQGEDKVLKNTHFDAYCNSVTSRLELENFKQVRLEVADELTPLFLEENQAWKMYLVDGKIEHDSAKIIDFAQENKAACTFWTESSESLDIKGNSFTITKQSTGTIDLSNQSKLPTVDFVLRLGAQKRDDNSSKATPRMSCVGLDPKNVDVKLIKKALGSLLAVKPAAATAAAAQETEQD